MSMPRAGTIAAVEATAADLFAPGSLAILNFDDTRLCSRLGCQTWRRRRIRE